MATTNVQNDTGQNLDTIFSEIGDPNGKLKLAVGEVTTAASDDPAAWQGVATHVEGATFGADDGVVVQAGVVGGIPTGLVHPLNVDDEGRLISSPNAGNLTDAADLSLNTAATSQSLFNGNDQRKYLIIQNNDAAAVEDIWINFGAVATAASPSIKIAAGGTLEFSAGFVPTQSVAWIAATIGHVVSAKEG